MSDLSRQLLRDEKSISYGATLQNIVALRKGRKMDKQVKITIDGDEYDPIDCKNVNITWVGREIQIKIDVEDVEDTEIKKDAPAATGFVIDEDDADTPTATYDLHGDDLEAFILLSPFRKEKILDMDDLRKRGVIEQDRTLSIESLVYNIQDLLSVQNASMDLTEQETKYLADGYQILKISTPRYVYEDKDNFKLIETVTLIKIEDSE